MIKKSEAMPAIDFCLRQCEQHVRWIRLRGRHLGQCNNVWSLSKIFKSKEYVVLKVWFHLVHPTSFYSTITNENLVPDKMWFSAKANAILFTKIRIKVPNNKNWLQYILQAGYCWIGLLDCNPIWWIGLWMTIQSQNRIWDSQSSYVISIQIQNIKIILSKN